MDFTISIEGTHPLLMHNGRMANPLDPFAKRHAEAAAKRNKSDEDYEELARREWAGSLYFDPDEGPYMPSANIERALLDAARMRRLGKTIERGLFITSEINPLDYNGPRDVETLMASVDHRHLSSVKVGRVRVMRCRPHFREWGLTADGWLDEDQLNADELRVIVKDAGRLVGLGDWRPRFGRFNAEVEFHDDVN